MSGRQSPFAALTGAEKQIKWLEYQSIRLPYVQGSVDALMEEHPTQHQQLCEPKPNKDSYSEHICEQPQSSPTRSQPSQTVDTEKLFMQQRQPMLQSKTATHLQAQASKPNDFQKTRHRQYDAVIARMKQAEQRASGFSALS